MIEKKLKNINLVIASQNIGKVNEFRQFLSKYPVLIHSQPENLKINETGKTFQENARIKSINVAINTGKFALADDSGLCVEQLKGAPGIYSARYEKTDKKRIDKLLDELAPYNNRRAFFIASICFSSPEGKVLIEVEGKCDGLITKERRGKNGFGYDPIFEVSKTGLTFAQMDLSLKRKFSHRGIAFKKLENYLDKVLI